MKVGIDISYYNNLSQAQWDLLAKVIDFGIVRLCYGLSIDPMAATHIANLKRIGKPFAGYGWVDPTRSFTAQEANFESAVDHFKPASMFNDYEQYWSDWAAYMRQDLATAYATRLSPSQIEAYNLRFHADMTIRNGIPTGSYSGSWFISKYAPEMADWVYKKNYWEAAYLRYTDPVDLAAKRKEWGIPFDISRVRELASIATISNGVIGRQFESYLEISGLLPNIGYHLDWNVMSDAGFATMLNQAVTTPEPPAPAEYPIPFPIGSYLYEVLTAINVRDFPTTMGSKIVDWKGQGDKVVVSEILGKWGRITEGWIYLPNCKPIL